MAETEPLRLIDLDAAKEARATELGDPPVVRWKGKEHALPAELPVLFLELIADDFYEEALDLIFAEEGWARAFLDDPDASTDDLGVLADGIARVYGIVGGLGKSSASGAGSSTTSDR